jgi:hypothetical protein
VPAVTALVLSICLAGSPARRHLAIPLGSAAAGPAGRDASGEAVRTTDAEPVQARRSQGQRPAAVLLLPFLMPLQVPLGLLLPLPQAPGRPVPPTPLSVPLASAGAVEATARAKARGRAPPTGSTARPPADRPAAPTVTGRNAP